EIRDNVMIVRVEPFGDLARRKVVRSTRGCEIGVQAVVAVGGAVDRRDRADHGAGIQHMVEEGKIIAGNVSDPGRFLAQPIRTAEGCGPLVQRGPVDLAVPVGFDGRLELTAGTDAGKAERAGGDGQETTSPLPPSGRASSPSAFRS